MSTTEQKVYLLYKVRRTMGYSFEELIDVYSSKKSADEVALKKNSYTPLGRAYDYIVKAKKLK
ncbi:TPA: hypothetical protein ACKP84_003791 [Serratia marcescens]|nr:hypothetical protein [Serratia marcescens]HEJ7006125.1 hypothetical protein [Serratia marcescens]